MTYLECLEAGFKQLNEAGVTDAKNDAYLLLEFVCSFDKHKYLMCMNDTMPAEDVSKYDRVIKKRASRIPLQHITGLAPFFGHEFYVDANVLVPRFDTEVLVEEALRIIGDSQHLSVLDMCTGSGCIGLSIAAAKPDISLVLSDISDKALGVAKKNVDKICKDCSIDTEVSLVQSDIFDGIDLQKYEETFDIIVCNPPYIRWEDRESLEPEVFEHDPHMALFADDGGLYFYKRIIREAPSYLKAGGYLAFEIGYDQGRDVIYIMKGCGFKDIFMKNDLSNNNRVVLGHL